MWSILNQRNVIVGTSLKKEETQRRRTGAWGRPTDHRVRLSKTDSWCCNDLALWMGHMKGKGVQVEQEQEQGEG